MHRVLDVVLSVYDISYYQLVGKSRKGKLPEARKMACYFLLKNSRATEIAELLRVDISYIQRACDDISFYLKKYPKIEQRAMSIENTLGLQQKATEIEQWLLKNYNHETTIVHEKQKELASINQKLKLCQ